MAPRKSGAVARNGIAPSRTYVRPPASSEAAPYRQTAASTSLTPSPIGRPAYHIAGMVSSQKLAVQATAIPTGPQGRATINNRTVTANSTSAQQNQRSARPIDK